MPLHTLRLSLWPSALWGPPAVAASELPSFPLANRASQQASHSPSHLHCSCQASPRVNTPGHSLSLWELGTPYRTTGAVEKLASKRISFSLNPENPVYLLPKQPLLANSLSKWWLSEELQERRVKWIEQLALAEGKRGQGEWRAIATNRDGNPISAWELSMSKTKSYTLSLPGL